MKIHEIRKVCRTFGVRCYPSIFINAEGKTEVLSVRFYGISKEKANRLRRFLGFKTMEKDYLQGEEDWKARDDDKTTVIIDEVTKCKIVGYKEEWIPPKEGEWSKKPIYECGEK